MKTLIMIFFLLPAFALGSIQESFKELEKARKYFQEENFKKAVLHSHRALKKFPNNGIAMSYKGRSAFQLKKYKTAIKCLKQAHDPQFSLDEKYFLIGVSHFRLKQNSQAKEYFDQIVNIENSAFKDQAQIYLAAISAATGNTESAELTLENVINATKVGPLFEQATELLSQIRSTMGEKKLSTQAGLVISHLSNPVRASTQELKEASTFNYGLFGGINYRVNDSIQPFLNAVSIQSSDEKYAASAPTAFQIGLKSEFGGFQTSIYYESTLLDTNSDGDTEPIYSAPGIKIEYNRNLSSKFSGRIAAGASSGTSQLDALSTESFNSSEAHFAVNLVYQLGDAARYVSATVGIDDKTSEFSSFASSSNRISLDYVMSILSNHWLSAGVETKSTAFKETTRSDNATVVGFNYIYPISSRLELLTSIESFAKDSSVDSFSYTSSQIDLTLAYEF